MQRAHSAPPVSEHSTDADETLEAEAMTDGDGYGRKMLIPRMGLLRVQRERAGDSRLASRTHSGCVNTTRSKLARKREAEALFTPRRAPEMDGEDLLLVDTSLAKPDRERDAGQKRPMILSE
jgi:hypothetical protein